MLRAEIAGQSGDQMEPAEIKRTVNEQLARMARALANPGRLELLELLAQGERPVDALAAATSQPVTTVSSQLQVLREARFVESRREATRVYYRVASDQVVRLLSSLAETARARLPEVARVTELYYDAAESPTAGEPVDREELLGRARRGEVVVVDVRPRVEYQAGHIEGALSMPLDELERRVSEIPTGVEIVAYCRGPYCVLAPEAVRLLRRRGRHARRLRWGMPEWKAAGLPVETGGGERVEGALDERIGSE